MIKLKSIVVPWVSPQETHILGSDRTSLSSLLILMLDLISLPKYQGVDPIFLHKFCGNITKWSLERLMKVYLKLWTQNENNEVPPLSLTFSEEDGNQVFPYITVHMETMRYHHYHQRLVKKTVIKSFPYITIRIAIFKASLDKVFHKYLQKSKIKTIFKSHEYFN